MNVDILTKCIFNKVFTSYNPRNEREFEDVINDIIKEVKNITWNTYSIWAFGSDATQCCVCEDTPEHYIQCHTCDHIICNDCFDNDVLCGDSFYMITITNTKGQLGSYYCKQCYSNIHVS